MKSLKFTYLIILLVLFISSACHKFNLNTNSSYNPPNCSNQVVAALITPTDLASIINGSGFKKIYLQFKTADDKHFSPAAYSDNNVIPFTDESSKFIPFGLASPLMPPKPYIFGNLEWKFPVGFSPNMSLQYYCLLPAMDADGVHVTYTYVEIPSTFQYKDSSFTVDTSFVQNSNPERIDSLTVHAAAAAATSGANLNPCPPKKPSS